MKLTVIIFSLSCLAVFVCGAERDSLRPARSDDPNVYTDAIQKMADRLSLLEAEVLAEKTALRNEKAGVIQELQSRLNALKQRRQALQDAYKEKVAFTAFMTQHNQVSGSVGTVIRFDGVVVNDGGAYNPHAGAFVASYDGSYWFYVHLEEDHVTAIDFRKNGAEQVRCDRDNVLPILTCGVVMKLTAGDTVTVNHALDGNGSILPLDKQSWFTGFLFH